MEKMRFSGKKRVWGLIGAILFGVLACAGIVGMFGAVMTLRHVSVHGEISGPLVSAFLKFASGLHSDVREVVQTALKLLFWGGLVFCAAGIFCSAVTLRADRGDTKRLGLLFLLLHILFAAVLLVIMGYTLASLGRF